MKRHWMKALALLLALTLTVITIALAEENVATGDADDELIEVVESTETEPVAEEVEEIALDDLMDLPAEEEPAAGETPEDTDWNGVQTWWFIAGDEAVAVLEAREGEEIQLPDDPAAPEGMAFDGWYYEDETPVLADADGDGEIDAVIAHPDPLVPEVNVLARFVEAEEPTAEEPTEEPAGEEPTEEEPTQEPSPLGEGGTEQSDVTEEVASSDDANNEDEGEGETTSSVSPDGEPASPKGEAFEETEEPSVGEASEPAQQPSVEEEASEATPKPSPDGEGGAIAPEEVPSPAEDAPAPAAPTLPAANALTYTGEAQPLVTGEGWLYSLDGVTYGAEIPTAIDAGEYTVFFKAAETDEPQTLTVTVAKADVVFTPPVAVTGEE